MRQILTLCIFLILLSGCENQTTIQTKSYPLLETVVKKNSSDGVLFGGRFLSKGDLDIKEAGFLFSKTKDTWHKINVKDFSEEFEYNLKTDIEEGALYYVKAYAISDDFVSYGNIAYFVSEGFNSQVPVVERFSPVNVSDGYKAYIFGKNFSFLKEKVSITFNGIKCLIFYSTLDTIIYRIPVLPTAKDYTGTLKVNDKEVTFGPVSVKNPVILDYYPKSGFDGTLVTIRGDFLTTDPTVFFGIYGCSALSNKDSVITVKSPQIAFSGELSLRVEVSGKSSGNYGYTVLSHSISGISNISGQVGSSLEIYGSSFLQNGRTSTVYFNDSKAVVSSCLNDKIVVYVPNFSGTEAVIRVINGAKESTFAGFTKTITWERLIDFPGDARTLSVGIGVNSDGYIGLGSKYYNTKDMLSDWWKYNSGNDSWMRLKDFPGEARYNSISFAMNNKIYVGLGTTNLNLNVGNEYFFHDLWEYDIAGNEWSLKKPPPLSSDIYYALSYASALTYNQKAYILTPGKLQVYDPAGDLWSELDAPSFYVSSNWYPLKPFCFNISDRLFWFFGYQTSQNWSTVFVLNIYEYFPVTNTWVLQKTCTDIAVRSQSVSFVLDNKGYFGGGTVALSNGAASSFFWEFNPETFEIIQKETFYRNCSGQSSFVINDKAYVGFGINNSAVSQKDFWKFSQY